MSTVYSNDPHVNALFMGSESERFEANDPVEVEVAEDKSPKERVNTIINTEGITEVEKFRLVDALSGDIMPEIKNSKGELGTASENSEGIYVFIGKNDGSDDKQVTLEEFNANYKVSGFMQA